MIDLNLRLSPDAFAAAETGDAERLRAELAPAELDAGVVDAIVGAVTDAEVRVDVIDADGRGATVRRGHIAPAVSLLHANGDERDTLGTVLVTHSGAELLHILLAGLGLGPRPDAQGPDEVVLDDPQDSLRAAMGTATLPDAVTPPSERALRWWSIATSLPDARPITVLDAQRLWRQRGAALAPTDALEVWDEFAPLLHLVSRHERPTDPDAQPPTDEAAAPADEGGRT